MNHKRGFVKFCLLAVVSLVESLPFSTNSDLQHPKNVESEVCIYNDIIYPAGHNFTSSNPCETCICDPPRYKCTVKNCLLKVGCKALHMANECCPQYICDCEKDGKRYANGEKVNEANPCKVCYCVGGDIKCNLVECYSRSDCEPVYVPGRCCPKYEHCPPLEQMRYDNSKETEKPEVLETTLDVVTSSESVRSPTVATLEIFEIYPTVSQRNKPELKRSSSVEPELNATVLNVTEENMNVTAETEETTVNDESSTLVTEAEADTSGTELNT